MEKQAESWKSKLTKIKVFVFDIDGVITDGKVYVMPDGQLTRTINTKDGMALKHAVKKGYKVAVISGGNSGSIKDRLAYLGITDVFLKKDDKLPVFEQYLKDHNMKADETLYMGDDIFDIPVLKRAGLACAPSDAAWEVLQVAEFISSKKGGEGAVREIIEQVLRARGDWF